MANDVDAVNQDAAVMAAATANGTAAERRRAHPKSQTAIRRRDELAEELRAPGTHVARGREQRFPKHHMCRGDPNKRADDLRREVAWDRAPAQATL